MNVPYGMRQEILSRLEREHNVREDVLTQHLDRWVREGNYRDEEFGGGFKKLMLVSTLDLFREAFLFPKTREEGIVYSLWLSVFALYAAAIATL